MCPSSLFWNRTVSHFIGADVREYGAYKGAIKQNVKIQIEFIRLVSFKIKCNIWSHFLGHLVHSLLDVCIFTDFYRASRD